MFETFKSFTVSNNALLFFIKLNKTSVQSVLKVFFYSVDSYYFPAISLSHRRTSFVVYVLGL